MLFSALLLIAWVTITFGGPLFPEKEIHLQIPLRGPFSGVSSRISPLIFRESMVVHSEYPTRTDSFRKMVESLRSSANPGDIKALAGLMNSPLKFRSGKNIPNMNILFPSNGKDGNEMTHLSHFRGYRDLRMKQKGNGSENGTLVYDHDHPHYVRSSEEESDPTINDTVEHSGIQNFEGSPLNRGNGKKDEDSFETATFLDATLFSDKIFVPPKIDEGNKSGIHFENGNPGDINRTRNDLSVHKLTNEEKQGEIYLDNFHKASNKMKYPTYKNGSKPVFINDFNITNVKPKSIDQSQTSTTSSSVNYKNLATSTKHRNEHILRKYKTAPNSTDFPNFKSSQSPNKSNKSSKHLPMQQDGAYEILTSPNGMSTDNGEGNSNTDMNMNEDNRNQRDEEFFKNIPPTTIQSSVVTTPDSHMNDPPFRGPNVPQEIDHFHKEKDEVKIDYRKPSTIVESPASQSLNIDEELKQAKQVWGIAWEYHCYIIGSLFAIIALYSFFSLLRTKTFVTLLSTGYYTTTNSFIFLMCLMRAFYLLYDPYNLSGKYPVIMSRILLKITLPILTSSFCLLVLALLNFTKTQYLSPKFQRPFVLGVIIAFLFSIFVTLEIVSGIFYVSSLLLLGCYLIIISCASLSSLCYFFIFKKLHHRALRKQGEMIRLTFTKMHIDGAQLPKKLPKPTLGLAVKLVLVSAFIQLLLCFLSPYAVIFLQGLFPDVTIPNPWFWWGYQLSCRILELIMCATMSFVATQPLKHYEIGDNRFCSILMWFPCSSFAECFRKEEMVDFEAHSDNYANPQGVRSTRFNMAASSRRLQTNSLPTFRTPLTEVDNNLPMRTLPYTGRHTNHASAVSLLSYYRSKRTLSLSTNQGLEDLERTLCSQTISSSDGRNSLRPASMLYKDNGFIRFRRETDPEQPMEMSDEDDRGQEEVDTSLEDADSTKANVGSSFHSLLEGDIVQNTLSPFFQIGYKRRFRKMSRISIETTDYSADVSSDQLSNVVNLRSGLSSSALDFNTRKYGSTCSSESAANSFDVTFFLNSTSSPEMQTSPTSTTPASLNVCSAYRSETEDDKTSSVEGHEVMLRSVSPIVKRASSGRLSLNLNLHSATDTSHSNGHVNVACGTEDITPDSAVYLDLQLSRENSMSPKLPQKSLPSNRRHQLSPVDSCTKSTDGISPLTPETASRSPSISPTSQSLSELRTSNSYVVSRVRKNSRGLLCKLRGSTFSLNAAFYGYEPLEHVESRKTRRIFERSSSDRRPLSEGQLEVEPRMTPLGELWQRTTVSGSGPLGDSGLLGDCGVALVDVASQTEDTELSECPNKHCKHLTKESTDTESPITHFYAASRT